MRFIIFSLNGPVNRKAEKQISIIYVHAYQVIFTNPQSGCIETLYLALQFGGPFLLNKAAGGEWLMSWLTGSRQQDLSHKDTVGLTMKHPCGDIGGIDGDARLDLASLGNSKP